MDREWVDVVLGNRDRVELAAGGSIGLSRGPKAGKLQYWNLSPVLFPLTAFRRPWDDPVLTSKLWVAGKSWKSDCGSWMGGCQLKGSRSGLPPDKRGRM